jgi:transposase
MPRPYSGDLRRRVVVAALEGGQSRNEIARRFVVGRSSVYRWIETAQAEGRLEAKPMRGASGPVIRDEAEAALKDLVKAENHLTLLEYRDRLAEETGVRVHPWTIGRAMPTWSRSCCLSCAAPGPMPCWSWTISPPTKPGPCARSSTAPASPISTFLATRPTSTRSNPPGPR